MGLYRTFRSAKWLLSGHPGNSYASFLRKSQEWSRDQLETYRNEKLKALLQHCFHNVPYYRKQFQEHGINLDSIQSAEDLSCIPILTKENIRTHLSELLASNYKNEKIFWSKTGGTTGEPIHIAKDQKSTAWENMCYERGLAWGGLALDLPRVRLFGGSLGLARERMTTYIGNVFRKDLFIPAFELTKKNALVYLEEIRKCNYKFILGYSSALFRLAVLSRELNFRLRFSAAFPTAELLLPEWKKEIEENFDCQVLPYYGCGEVNSLGFTHRDDASYLIPEEHVIIETVRHDGVSSLNGEGRFVVTNLDNFAMPIIRYDLGDAGVVTQAQGKFPFSRIARIDGRYNSLLLSESGDLISGAIGAHIFRNFPSVKAYRIVQTEPLKIVIALVPKNDFSNFDETRIAELFKKYLGQSMWISIERIGSLPPPASGKSVFVINQCL